MKKSVCRVRSVLRIRLLLIAVIGLAGCSKEKKAENASVVRFELGEPAKTPVSLASGDASLLQPPMTKFGSGSSDIWMPTIEIEGEFVTPVPVTLDQDYVMEFTPVWAGREVPAGESKIQTHLIESDGEVLLAETAFSPEPEDRLLGMRRYALLQPAASIDLSAHRGKSVRLKWVASPAQSQTTALLAFFRLRPKPRPADTRPNILLICSDTHRVDRSIEGAGPAMMPELTKLRERAVTYSRAFSQAPWTLPSITSTLTGLFPRHHLTGKILEIGKSAEFDPKTVQPGAFYLKWEENYRVLQAYSNQLTTIGEALQREGYSTALIHANTHYTLSGLGEDGHDLMIDTHEHAGVELNAEALALLEKLPRDRPIFLVAHYIDVHQYLGWRFQQNHPGAYEYDAPTEQLREAYDQSVGDCDRFLGQLLDAWDATAGPDSMVVFYSDHGEHLRDPGCRTLEELNAPNTWETHCSLGILGHGNSMAETLLHVPLVIRYPLAVRPKEARCENTVSLVDLFPTILQVAGGKPDDLKLDGQSLLAGDWGEGSERRDLYADYPLLGDDLSAVREGPMKLTLNHNRQEITLMDTRIMPGDKGEAGQRVKDREVEKRLGAAFVTYAETAQEQTKGLRSNREFDSESSVDELKKLGYLK